MSQLRDELILEGIIKGSRVVLDPNQPKEISMSNMNQKQGVYVVVMNVLAEKGIGFDDGQETSAKELLGKEGTKQVRDVVAAALMGGEIEMTADSRIKYSTEEAMKEYSSGLVNNWLRKDTRLNGGAKYEAKNPGSRSSSSDAQIKELKKLLILKADDSEACETIQAAIDARQAEITKEKAKTIEIDVTQIPEHLKHLLG